ncbi:MAG: L-histidine N(alpha)-methyltransferase, partial [Candidatus Eisenbacteria bacterium]
MSSLAARSGLRRDAAAIAAEVRAGLGGPGRKTLPSRLLYDDLGSALFDAICLLPEYGLTRADERILFEHGREIAGRVPSPVRGCALELSVVEGVRVRPIGAEYREGLARVAASRRPRERVLVLFLGSTIGNFDRGAAEQFLRDARQRLEPGDALLLGTDLMKPVPRLLAAYDDALGVTAAFNLNLLVRVNRELMADFQPSRFEHQARWNATERRIEMHLVSRRAQDVTIRS